MTDEQTSPALIPLDRAPFTFKTLQAISRTEFVPTGLRGKTEAILACILTGRELGLGPMESMRSIDVIDGRPSPTGEFMARRVFEAGHVIVAEQQTAESCTVKGIRYRDGKELASMTFTFTMDMARRAGLTNKTNWKHYPEAMLYWRAVSQLVRQFFPDVIGGISHLPDELGDAEWVEEPVTDADYVTVTEVAVTQGADEIEDAEVIELEEGSTLTHWAVGSELDGPIASGPLEDPPSDPFDWDPVPSGKHDSEAIAEVRAQASDNELVNSLRVVTETASVWLGRTVPDVERGVRYLCRGMEALQLWDEDSLHAALKRRGVLHLGDLKKASLVSLGMELVDQATKDLGFDDRKERARG